MASPKFLFRIERDPVDATAGKTYRIGDLELAARCRCAPCEQRKMMVGRDADHGAAAVEHREACEREIAAATVRIAGDDREILLQIVDSGPGLSDKFLSTVGDMFNALNSTSFLGTVFNAIAWPLSILVVSVAVWIRTPARRPTATEEPAGFMLPALAAGAALTILFVG